MKKNKRVPKNVKQELIDEDENEDFRINETDSSVYLSQEQEMDKSTRAGKSSKGQSKDGNSAKGGKKSNTVIQQIKAFSLTPMNDNIAEEVLEDHKYLLHEVQNRAAIAYFAAANRNLSLYNALKKYMDKEGEDDRSEGSN